MIPEKEREALMRLVMCARDECEICKYKDKYTYRIDWLLDHLAQEISLLEGYRRGRKEDG